MSITSKFLLKGIRQGRFFVRYNFTWFLSYIKFIIDPFISFQLNCKGGRKRRGTGQIPNPNQMNGSTNTRRSKIHGSPLRFVSGMRKPLHSYKTLKKHIVKSWKTKSLFDFLISKDSFFFSDLPRIFE